MRGHCTPDWKDTGPIYQAGRVRALCTRPEGYGAHALAALMLVADDGSFPTGGEVSVLHIGSISASPTLRGGHFFEYRHAQTRATDVPSAMPRWSRYRDAGAGGYLEMQAGSAPVVQFFLMLKRRARDGWFGGHNYIGHNYLLLLYYDVTDGSAAIII